MSIPRLKFFLFVSYLIIANNIFGLSGPTVNTTNIEVSGEFIEDKCISIRGKKCTDFHKKTISGKDIERCWQFEEILKCTGYEKNYCKNFEDNKGCQELYSFCIQWSESKETCRNLAKKFRCNKKIENISKTKHIDIEYSIKLDKKSLLNCTKDFIKNCIIENEKCLEPNEIKKIHGRYVYRDCWRWSLKYYCKQSTLIDECQAFKDICKEKSRNCLYRNNLGECEYWHVKLNCRNKATTKMGCRDLNRVCIGKICKDVQRFYPNNLSKNFGELLVLSQLKKSNLNEDQECLIKNPNYESKEDLLTNNCVFFAGSEHRCHKFKGQWLHYLIRLSPFYMSWEAIPLTLFPKDNLGIFSNKKFINIRGSKAFKFEAATTIPTKKLDCCSINKPLSVYCSNKSKDLKWKKEQGLCVRIGRYKKKMGFIAVTSYCCFKNKLSKIIYEQGRYQLGSNFGTSKNPNCQGFTVKELQSIDFSKIDWSELVEDFKISSTPDKTTQDLYVDYVQNNLKKLVHGYGYQQFSMDKIFKQFHS